MQNDIEKEKIKKHFKKENQDIRIIYHKLDGLGYIARFRDIWGLPPAGFSNQTNYSKWRNEFLIKRTNKVVTGDEYKALEKIMIRKGHKWARNKIPLSEIKTFGLKLKLKEPIFKFSCDIEAIMSKLAIPERYGAFIELSFVLKSPPNFFMIDKPSPRPFLITDPDTGRKKILIETYGDTKLEDFKSQIFAYDFKRLQPKVYDYGTIKKLGIPNFDIWEQLVKWRKGGKTYKEIRELAKNQFGYFIRYDDNVKTYIKRWKRRLAGTRKKKV